MPHASFVTPNTFGGMLRHLRLQAKLTQAELAGRVGFSDAQINRLERAARKPDPLVVAERFVPALGLLAHSEEATRLVALAQVAPHALESSQLLLEPVSAALKPPTELFGREVDTAAVIALIRQDTTRLVTLAGPPGIGKTRLSLAVADALASSFEHGTVFVPLAAVTDPTLIADSILQALQLASYADDPAVQLKQALRERTMLIVLDNLEQLLTQENAHATVTLIADLIDAAPCVKFIVSSRALLRSRHERVFDVPSLSPQAASELFEARARQVQQSFQLNDGNRVIVADICRRLDHLPLAIELAAARVRLFEPRTLLKRLSDPLALLNKGPLDLPDRQRTLHGAIDWSYRLLSPAEQALFRRIGSFADGCTWPMIQAVVHDEFAHTLEDVLQSLVEKSLVAVATVHGDMRFQLLEMLREYAHDALVASGEYGHIMRRQADWFVACVESNQSDPARQDSGPWFDWYDTEWKNLRAVFTWSLYSGELSPGMRLAACMGITWRLHGPLHEGFQVLRGFLAHPLAAQEELLLAKMLLAAAHVAEGAGDAPGAESYVVRGLEIARRLDEPHLTAHLLSLLADHASARGELSLARQLFLETIALARECGDDCRLVSALVWMSSVDCGQGQAEAALEKCLEARQIAYAIQWQIGMFMADLWMTWSLRMLGQQDRAIELNRSALRICEENKLVSCTQLVRASAGADLMEDGRYAEAIEFLEPAVTQLGLFGDPDTQAGMSIPLGMALFLDGTPGRAESLLIDAIHVLVRCERASDVPNGLMALGWIAATTQRPQRALRLMSAGATLRRRTGAEVSPHIAGHQERYLTMLRPTMPADELHVLWQEGQGMDLQAALRYAAALENHSGVSVA